MVVSDERILDGGPGRLRTFSHGISAAWTLCERELVRFFRQRNRVIGALGQPLIFWLLFGSGLRASFRPGWEGSQISYAEYFYPGVVVLIVLFTAIFATISIIEDRREGFLQEVLIAPVPRAYVVAGKVLGGAALSLIQAWIFLLLAPAAGIWLTFWEFLAATGVLVLLGVALTSLGVCLAWRMDSTQGFHAIMSVFLMPMWLLSGAFFPSDGVALWLRIVIAINPLTYGVASLRRVFYLSDGPLSLGETPPLLMSLAITGGFAAVMFTAAAIIASKRRKGQ